MTQSRAARDRRLLARVLSPYIDREISPFVSGRRCNIIAGIFLNRVLDENEERFREFPRKNDKKGHILLATNAVKLRTPKTPKVSLRKLHGIAKQNLRDKL